MFINISFIVVLGLKIFCERKSESDVQFNLINDLLKTKRKKYVKKNYEIILFDIIH
jgi:hypothetical protein